MNKKLNPTKEIKIKDIKKSFFLKIAFINLGTSGRSDLIFLTSI